MKLRQITTLLIFCAVLVGCDKELPLYNGEVLSRDGLLYKPNSTVPLTAKIVLFHENGQPENQYTVLKGKREGLSPQWYVTGQLRSEATYVSGKKEGIMSTWNKSGAWLSRSCFRDGDETYFSECENES